MRLVRSHGIGNDYLVLHSDDEMSPARARALCHRHTGVGGDGVLQAVVSERADYGLVIWNPDGSTAEKSGNGLRIFARYLVDHCLAPLSFTVEVGGAVVSCTVLSDGSGVTVQMGKATVVPQKVPCGAALEEAPVDVGGDTLRLNAVGMGNPHCVCFVDDRLGSVGLPVPETPAEDPLETLPWRRWGALLEVHPLFPNRTNVQLVRVVDRHTLVLRVHERGAGPTLASGSSACAAAVAGVRTGRVASPVRVVMEGGSLIIEVGDDLSVVMTGPVEEICVVQTTRRFPA